MGSAHLTKLINLITKSSRGSLGKEQAVELRRLAQTSIGQESPSLEFELIQTTDAIQYFTKMLSKAKEEVTCLMSEIESSIITIPSIGNGLVSVILA